MIGGDDLHRYHEVPGSIPGCVNTELFYVVSGRVWNRRCSEFDNTSAFGIRFEIRAKYVMLSNMYIFMYVELKPLEPANQ